MGGSGFPVGDAENEEQLDDAEAAEQDDRVRCGMVMWGVGVGVGGTGVSSLALTVVGDYVAVCFMMLLDDRVLFCEFVCVGVYQYA